MHVSINERMYVCMYILSIAMLPLDTCDLRVYVCIYARMHACMYVCMYILRIVMLPLDTCDL